MVYVYYAALTVCGAYSAALTELSVEQVEAIVLSNPLPWQEMTLEQLLPLWRVLERFHAHQKVAYLGLADFEQSLFEAVCQCDQVSSQIRDQFI